MSDDLICPKCRYEAKKESELTARCLNPVECGGLFELPLGKPEVKAKEHEKPKEGTIVPIFESLPRKRHPAIDVHDDIASVGVWLPSKVTKENKEEIEEKFYIVTSNREWLPADSEEIQNGFKGVESRWTPESIKKYLDGEKVNPKLVFDQLRETIHYYLDFDTPEFYDFLTLWIIGTYFYKLFNYYPYVYFGGVKGSGKSKVLLLIELTSHQGQNSASISTSSLFRFTDRTSCTFCLDETEFFKSTERASELRAIILAGFSRGGKVWRSEESGGKYKPTKFDPYSPKAIANIYGLEDVLESRCITEIMKRTMGEQGKREIEVNNDRWSKIVGTLYNLFLIYWKEVDEVRNNFTNVEDVQDVQDVDYPELVGRDRNLWKPILTLATFFDKYNVASSGTSTSSTGSTYSTTSLTQSITDLLKTKIKETLEEEKIESPEMVLIITLLEIVAADDYYSIGKITDSMITHFDEKPKWLNGWWVGKALKRLGFRDRTRSDAAKVRLTKESVEDLAKRMNVELKDTNDKEQEQDTDEISIVDVSEEVQKEYPSGQRFKCVYPDCGKLATKIFDIKDETLGDKESYNTRYEICPDHLDERFLRYCHRGRSSRRRSKEKPVNATTAPKLPNVSFVDISKDIPKEYFVQNKARCQYLGCDNIAAKQIQVFSEEDDKEEEPDRPCYKVCRDHSDDGSLLQLHRLCTGKWKAS